MPLSIGLDIAPSYTTDWSQLNRSYPVSPILANRLPQLSVESPITKCFPTELKHPENRLEFLAIKEAWRWKSLQPLLVLILELNRCFHLFQQADLYSRAYKDLLYSDAEKVVLPCICPWNLLCNAVGESCLHRDASSRFCVHIELGSLVDP